MSANYEKIARAYGLKYTKIETITDVEVFHFDSGKPQIVEIIISEETTLQPNFGSNGKIQDQRPYIDRKLYEEIMQL